MGPSPTNRSPSTGWGRSPRCPPASKDFPSRCSRGWRLACRSWRRGQEETPTSSRRAKRGYSFRRSSPRPGPPRSSGCSAIRRSPRGPECVAASWCGVITRSTAWSSEQRASIVKRWSVASSREGRVQAPITVVIPTLNEAAQIAACIRHLDWTADVVVVDGGSTDDTVALARAAGARVITDAPRSIGEQRNAGIAVARHDWVFALDADERIGPELAQEVMAVQAGANAAGGTNRAHRGKRPEAFRGRVLPRGPRGDGWVVRLPRRQVGYGGRAGA